jgi:hypothetical protein
MQKKELKNILNNLELTAFKLAGFIGSVEILSYSFHQVHLNLDT